MMIFNYYNANILDIKPKGDVSLNRFIKTIREPKKDISETFEKIKQAEINGDMKLKSELKTKLYYFTPCVYVAGGRKYSNIKHFTGLFVLDFDHLEQEYAKEFKQFLFDYYKSIIAAWLSPSRHGVKAFINIPICKDVAEYKTYYNAIEIEFNKYKGFDKAVKNCILPLFLSYDKDILQRDDYILWTKKYIPRIAPVVKQYIITNKSNKIEQHICNMINKINDNGHPQLRAAAYILGGYVGAGQISEYEAHNIIINLINTNAYLNQKANIYIKTAKTMIQKGQAKPIFI